MINVLACGISYSCREGMREKGEGANTQCVIYSPLLESGSGRSGRPSKYLDAHPRFGESSAMRSAVLLSLLLLFPGSARASETHCDDATVWHDWEERTANNPN